MKESTNREKVLKKVRDAIIDKSDNPYQNIDFDSSVYHENAESLDITFAEAFNESYGNFVYCADKREFINNFNFVALANKWDHIYCIDDDINELLKYTKLNFFADTQDFLNTKVGISKCEYLIARSGSIMVSSKQLSGRRINIFPEIHVVVAYTSQLVADIKQALKLIRTKYPILPSMITIINGPSRCVDIENEVILGAQGVRELYVFLIDENQ